MTIDFQSPARTAEYVALLEHIVAMQVAQARMFAGYTDLANIPTDAIRWNPVAGRLEGFASGLAWDVLCAKLMMNVDQLDGYHAADFATVGHNHNAAYQALDQELTAIAGLTSAVDQGFYFSGPGAAATYLLTSYMRSLGNCGNQLALQTALGLVPGTNVQAQNANLTALANTVAAILAVLASPDVATMRSNMGLGTGALLTVADALSLGLVPMSPGVAGATPVWGRGLEGHRNKLIGHFDVNQRGLTSVGDDAYCCDRWYVLTESGNVTVAQVADPESGAPFGLRLTQPDATAKRFGLAQIIEARNVKAFRSAAMNFFMRVKPSFAGNVRYAILEHTGTADTVTSDVVNNWASTTFTPGNFFIAGVNVIKTGVVAPGAATYGEFSDYGTLGAALNNAILFVWTESAQAQNSTLELNRPQFEPGVIHTPHEFRVNELELCQRYCQRVYPSGAGIGDTTTTAVFGFQVPVPMRAQATLALNAPAMISDTVATDFSQSSASVAEVVGATNNGSYFLLRFANFTGLTAYRPYVWRVPAAYLVMTAEL